MCILLIEKIRSVVLYTMMLQSLKETFGSSVDHGAANKPDPTNIHVYEV